LTALSTANAEDPAKPTQRKTRLFWSTNAEDSKPDSHVAFRATWNLEQTVDVEFRLLGASWFVAWIDGQPFAEGPARFPRTNPQYQTYRIRLKAGRHTLAIQVHHDGVDTRMMENQPPFLYAIVIADGKEIPLNWKCLRLDGYATQVRRLNPQLSWIEWCDTRLVPQWQSLDYADSSWKEPATVDRDLGPFEPLSTPNIRSILHQLTPIASGQLVERFGYERDNPAARFFLRDLNAKDDPPQGVWRRYDLGRVRLGRPRFVFDLPPGAVVEFAYAEYLTHERVAPWITLSGGDSCNFDHYVARGGPQEFCPLTPKGGRFVEVHILAPPANIKTLTQEYIERCYYGDPIGSFHCDDESLNRIWSVGVETLRACAEDAPIDNPTRERGQWTGDWTGVGMNVAAAAFDDLRLFRRGLVQCAECARSDGLVAGMCPGPPIYLSTFAAQWVNGCFLYWQLTGDRSLFEQLLPAAERNFAAFEKHCTPDGLDDALGWGFVDWGYVRNSGPSDMGVNLHYLAALRDMTRWCDALGKADRTVHYQKSADTMAAIIERYLHAELAQGNDPWSRIGYHRAALALRLGFFHGDEEKACVAFVKSHLMRCFPNDPTAPRLTDPGASNPRLITPYFAHFVLPTLIECGEMDFVLDQYRTCWGWALQDGRTTWLEVFDTRWSYCHQWAGCPTWQLSRYVLGLHPRYDLGKRHFMLKLLPGSLQKASGQIPLNDTDKAIRVQWEKKDRQIHYTLTCPEPITLHVVPETMGAQPRVIQVNGQFDEIFRAIPK
jgi:hypothetical protein